MSISIINKRAFLFCWFHVRDKRVSNESFQKFCFVKFCNVELFWCDIKGECRLHIFYGTAANELMNQLKLAMYGESQTFRENSEDPIEMDVENCRWNQSNDFYVDRISETRS